MTNEISETLLHERNMCISIFKIIGDLIISMTVEWYRKTLNLFGLLAFLLVASANSGGESIYFRSQKDADAALAAFDRANPDCQLWTNWQKICSRTGKGGAVACADDAAAPARPSTPFCIAPIRPESSLSRKSALQRVRSATGFFEVNASKPSSVDPWAQCETVEPNRPFSGRSIASRRHPYCRVWAEEGSGHAICSENPGSDGLPSCQSLAQQKIVTKSPLYCASEFRKKIKTCLDPKGLIGRRRNVWRPPFPKMDQNEHDDIIAVADGEDYILSIYCEG